MRAVSLVLAAIGVLLHLLVSPEEPGRSARTNAKVASRPEAGAVDTTERAPGALPVDGSRGDPEASRAAAGPANALRSPALAPPSAESGNAREKHVTWSNRDPMTAGLFFDPRDLRVLADLIEANRLDESSSATDFDNGDGVLEPLEVGFQQWRNGRLVSFATGADRYDSFGYALTVLPPSLGDLAALEELDLQTNRVAALPDSIADLHQLQVLRLHRNGLQTLSGSIGALSNLRELSIGENALETLPVQVVGLAALEELHANDNPLAKLPEEIGMLPRLRVLNVSHALPADPVSDAASSDVGLVELPRSIEHAPALETLLVAGNHLFCAGAAADPGLAPVRLRDGSIPGLYGLASQVCGGQRSR